MPGHPRGTQAAIAERERGRERERDGNCKDGFIGILDAKLEADSMPTHQLGDTDGDVINVQIERSPVYRDDLTSQLLDP